MRAFVASVVLVIAGNAGAQETPFHGPYVTLGGSYAHSEPLGFTGVGFRVVSISEPLRGPSGITAAGYNLQVGHAIFGIEASGRFGREFLSNEQTTTVVDFGEVITEAFKITHESRGGAHLSLRGGVAVGNVMIFGQAGLGASEHTSKLTVSGSGARCTQNAFIGGQFVCVARTPLLSGSAEQSLWVPSALFGAGIEVNYMRLFTRIAAQAEGAWISRNTAASTPNARLDFLGDDVLWTARATASIGMRF